MIYKEFDLLTLPMERKDIYLAMGYGLHLPEGMIRNMVSEVCEEIRFMCIPRYIYQIADSTLSPSGRLEVSGHEFSLGGIIGSYLPGITQSCFFIATAGREYESYLHQIKQSGDIVKEFVADSIGTVIAEACVHEIGKELGKNPDYSHTLPYSPGYCGWPIREQKKLFQLFPDSPCGVTLTDSYLMTSVKLVSGFFGLGTHIQPQPYRCEICQNTHCYKRAVVN